MADTYTSILNVPKFEEGTRENSWGDDFGTEVLDVLDLSIAGVGTAITTTGGASSVTEDNSRQRTQRITGVLGSNATISMPANATWWIFSNETSGNFSVTVKPSGGTGAIIPQGRKALYIQSATVGYFYTLTTGAVIDTGGTSSAYTGTTNLNLSANVDGMSFLVRFNADCAATPTLNLDSIGAVTMLNQDGSAIAAADLKANSTYWVVYRSSNTRFYVQNGVQSTVNSALTAEIADAGTTSVVRPFIARHSTSGTAAAGFGVGYSFYIEDASGNVDEVGRIDYVSTDVTHGSEDGEFVFSLMVGGSITEIFRVAGAGLLKRTAGYSVAATNTNDSASAGYVGYIVESEVLVGSAVSLTSNVAANITSISLPAGDYDVWATFASNGSAANQTLHTASINTTSATHSTSPGKGAHVTIPVTNNGTTSLMEFPVGMRRLSLSATTTVYLVMTAVFPSGTCGGYGYLGARVRR